MVALAKLHVHYLKLRTISGFSKKGSTSKVTVALPSVPSPLYNICSPPFISASRPASRLAKGTLPPLKLTERTNTSVDHPRRRQTHLPRTVPHKLVIQFHRKKRMPHRDKKTKGKKAAKVKTNEKIYKRKEAIRFPIKVTISICEAFSYCFFYL